MPRVRHGYRFRTEIALAVSPSRRKPRSRFRAILARFAVSLAGGLCLSYAAAWTVGVLTTEFPNIPEWIRDLTVGNSPVWARKNYEYFTGAEGNGRQWIGQSRQYWQPCQVIDFGRSRDYENPGVGYAPGTKIVHREPVTWLPDWSRARIPPTGHESYVMTYEVAAGWPWMAFHGACTIDYAKRIPQGGATRQPIDFRFPTLESVYWAINIKPANLQGHYGTLITMLPLHPIFPGAIYSLLFWSAAVLLLVLARDGLHHRTRYRRLARGRCPKCNHDLAGVSPCPECGTPIETEPPKPAATSAG